MLAAPATARCWQQGQDLARHLDQQLDQQLAHAPGRELCRLTCAADLSRGSRAAAIFLVLKPPPTW